jgi:hypothetical protein
MDGMDDKQNQELGRVAYEAYRAFSDGRSLVTNVLIPPFEDLAVKIREAWTFAAVAVQERTCEDLKETKRAEIFDLAKAESFVGENLSLTRHFRDSFQVLPQTRPIHIAFSVDLANAPIGTKVTYVGADGSKAVVEVSDSALGMIPEIANDEDDPIGEAPPESGNREESVYYEDDARYV